MNVSRKVWGYKYRIFENDKVELDLLYLEHDSACSIHSHKEKINLFFLIKGKVKIKTDLGEKQLTVNELFEVAPPMTHQFIVEKPSVMLEIAYVKDGTIKADDIIREVQGGKFVDSVFYTLEQLKDNQWTDEQIN